MMTHDDAFTVPFYGLSEDVLKKLSSWGQFLSSTDSDRAFRHGFSQINLSRSSYNVDETSKWSMDIYPKASAYHGQTRADFNFPGKFNATAVVDAWDEWGRVVHFLKYYTGSNIE